MTISALVTYVKTHIGTSIVLGLVGLGVLWWGISAFTPESVTYDSEVVIRQDVIQEVNVTGKIEAPQEADLGFVRSGRVNRIYVSSGESVQVGDPLISLDNADLVARLSQAEAQVNAESERLTEMIRGARPEEITVQEAEAESAQITFITAKEDLYQTLQDAYTKADDAVRNRADQFFNNPRSGAPSLSISPKGYITLDDDRRTVEDTLIGWERDVQMLALESALSSFANETLDHLSLIKNFLAELASLVNQSTTETTATERDSLYTGRLNVDTAISNVTTDQKSLEQASTNVTLENAQLALLKAGTRSEQLRAQEAQLRAAQASAREYRALVDETVLRAPFSGLIVRQDARIGEVVDPSTNLVAIISSDHFRVTLYVPEADIAKIAVGNAATFTLDAFESDVLFSGEVVHIDPAETVIEGVSTYKVTVSIDETEQAIRSGMTADVDILAGMREQVFAIPSRALVRDDDGVYVYVLEGGVAEKRTVETGLRGSDGRVEILSGLSEGDVVITSEVE